jgi:hypothetical protein
MKSLKFRKITLGLAALVIFLNFSPMPVLSAGDPIADSPANDSGWHLVIPCTGDKEHPGDCAWSDLIIFANRIVIFLVWLSASLAVMAFCYAGFLYMTAFGESGKIEQAHGIFKSALTGVFFVLCGWLIIATILKVLGADPNVVNTIDFEKVEKIQGQQR